MPVHRMAIHRQFVPVEMQTLSPNLPKMISCLEGGLRLSTMKVTFAFERLSVLEERSTMAQAVTRSKMRLLDK